MDAPHVRLSHDLVQGPKKTRLFVSLTDILVGVQQSRGEVQSVQELQFFSHFPSTHQTHEPRKVTEVNHVVFVGIQELK